MTNSAIIGATIEDNYISAGLVNLETRQIVDSSLRRKRTNPSASKEAIIDVWADVLSEVAQISKSSNIKIGIAVPGPLDYELGVYLSDDPERYGSLYRSNIKEMLAAKLGISRDDIRIINDAASFFQGEVFAGAVRGYKKSFGLTLGMGLGSARYVNGVVEDANLWKSPFKDTIAEQYLSSKWLVKRFKELSGIEVADIVEMKRFAPDARVQQAFDEFAQNLAEFIISVIKKESPEVVLIGGHMESSNRFFFGKTTEAVLASGIKTPIMRAILGEKAGVIGAASSWYDANALHSK